MNFLFAAESVIFKCKTYKCKLKKKYLINPCLKLLELMSTIKTTQKCNFYEYLCIFLILHSQKCYIKIYKYFLVVLYLNVNVMWYIHKVVVLTMA